MGRESPPLVYVSYSWRSRAPEEEAAGLQPVDDREQIVDRLCATLDQEEGIVVGRDKKRIRTGDSIEDFAREIASGGLILAVISHKSLRSDWCMVHELLQAFRRRNFAPGEFGSDVLALVLEDALDDFNDQNALVDHWGARLEQRLGPLQKADPDRKYSPESWKDVDALEELLGRLPDLLRALRIRAMPRGAAAIQQDGFGDIRALVRHRLAEKTGLASAISSSRVPAGAADPPAPPPVEDPGQGPSHFLAIVLERQVERQQEASAASGEFLYAWQAYLKTPSEAIYQPCTEAINQLCTELSHILSPLLRKPALSPEEDAPPGTTLAPDTLADLLQVAVDWLQRQPFGASCLLELFVPGDLLDFPWSAVPLIDRRLGASAGPVLLALVPFVLRSWERLEHPHYKAGREVLRTKFDTLVAGNGEWLAAKEACCLQTLLAAETHPTRVGIQRLDPLDSDPEPRRRWLMGMLASMAPVALWQPHGRSPAPTASQLRAHLKRHYPALVGHKTGDKVLAACARLEALPWKRKTIAAEPRVHDLVFLLDHPHRSPPSARDLPDLISL